MMIRKILILSLILGTTATAYAAPTFSTWDSAESQVRPAEAGGKQAQLNLFNKTSLSDLPRDISITDYFQYSRNWNPKENLYYLYNASFQTTQLTHSLGTILGRQTIVRGNYEGIMDGATIRLSPGDHSFYLDGFGGFTRTVETGDFTMTPGLMAGLQGGWRPNNDTQLTVMTAYNQNSYRTDAWKTSGAQLVGASGHIRLGETSQWKLYTDNVYDIGGRDVQLASLGAQWQITPLLSLALNGSRYDSNRNSNQPTILSLFTSSAMWLGRFGLNYYVSSSIKLFANYDLTSAKNNGIRHTGNVAEGGADLDFRKINLSGQVLYRFLDSFGGQDQDFLLTLNQRPIRFLLLDLFTNFSKYKKITNDNGYATSNGIGVSYEPKKWVSLRLGGEYLHNNVFKNEWRFDGTLVVKWDQS